MAVTAGLVGVGAMGTALLARLRINERQVKAFDLSEERMAVARDAGADPVPSIAEAARGVDCVHVFVRTDEEVLDATLGEGGVLSGAGEGTLLFLHSTVMPETTRRVAAEAAKRGLRPVDAPVTAVPRVVQAGDAVFLVGGAEADVAAARPLLEPLGKAMHHFGPCGSGNVAKIAKNLINAAERVVLSEVLAIVEAGGLDVKQFLDVAVSVDGRSTLSRWEGAFSIVDNHAVPRPASNLLNKDVGLAADLAKVLGVSTPMTDGAARTAAVWVAGWEKGD